MIVENIDILFIDKCNKKWYNNIKWVRMTPPVEKYMLDFII
jgi:hypothetical protein